MLLANEVTRRQQSSTTTPSGTQQQHHAPRNSQPNMESSTTTVHVQNCNSMVINNSSAVNVNGGVAGGGGANEEKEDGGDEDAAPPAKKKKKKRKREMKRITGTPTTLPGSTLISLPPDMFTTAPKSVPVEFTNEFFDYYRFLDQNQVRDGIQHPFEPCHQSKFRDIIQRIRDDACEVGVKSFDQEACRMLNDYAARLGINEVIHSLNLGLGTFLRSIEQDDRHYDDPLVALRLTFKCIHDLNRVGSKFQESILIQAINANGATKVPPYYIMPDWYSDSKKVGKHGLMLVANDAVRYTKMKVQKLEQDLFCMSVRSNYRNGWNKEYHVVEFKSVCSPGEKVYILLNRASFPEFQNQSNITETQLVNLLRERKGKSGYCKVMTGRSLPGWPADKVDERKKIIKGSESLSKSPALPPALPSFEPDPLLMEKAADSKSNYQTMLLEGELIATPSICLSDSKTQKRVARVSSSPVTKCSPFTEHFADDIEREAGKLIEKSQNTSDEMVRLFATNEKSARSIGLRGGGDIYEVRKIHARRKMRSRSPKYEWLVEWEEEFPGQYGQQRFTWQAASDIPQQFRDEFQKSYVPLEPALQPRLPVNNPYANSRLTHTGSIRVDDF
jgi:hypothetical protein